MDTALLASVSTVRAVVGNESQSLVHLILLQTTHSFLVLNEWTALLPPYFSAVTICFTHAPSCHKGPFHSWEFVWSLAGHPNPSLMRGRGQDPLHECGIHFLPKLHCGWLLATTHKSSGLFLNDALIHSIFRPWSQSYIPTDSRLTFFLLIL